MRKWFDNLSLQHRVNLQIQPILLVLLSAATFFIYQQLKSNIISTQVQRADGVAMQVIDSANMLMMTGMISNVGDRQLMIKKIIEGQHLSSLRLVRTEQVVRQYGPGLPEEHLDDPVVKQTIERSVSAGKSIPHISIEMANGLPMLRVITPYIESHGFHGTDCLTCHHVAVGSSNGASDIGIDLSGNFKRLNFLLTWLIAWQVGLQLLLFFIIAWASTLKSQQRQLEHMAHYDTLTGLPNRNALNKEFGEAMARTRRNGMLLAVGMLDLDQFKPVNDTYGHKAGDVLLCELARRFTSLVRETDFIARLGGDEFVVVIENLDEDQAVPQFTQALDRLHSAVEQPFEVLPGKFVTIDMTIGLALYPRHGTDGDSLMREADAAMYQAKTRKAQRDSWWQLGTQSQDAPLQEQEMGAFSLDAAEYLRQSQPLLESILVTFVEAFYHDLAQEPDSAEILATLSSVDMHRLKIQQADHLRFLLNPMTSHAEVMSRGQHLGRVHMLIGVNSIMLVQSYALFRHLLNQHLNLERIAARTRYRLMRLIDERLQIDLHAQLESGAHVVDYFQGISNHDLPLPGALWVDVAKDELARLGHLPGIFGVMLMRLDSRGIFIVEHSAGPKADAISQVLQSPENAVSIDPASPRGQGVSALAWRSNQIHSLKSYSADSRHAFWQEAAQSIGLRSVMAIPVTDMLGHVVTLLVFYGAYPNQFETSWMRQFAYRLQKRWGDLWTRTRGQSTARVMSQDKAHILRDRLFAGGLSMFMQPIVDLKSSQPVKFEALARLIMPDGQVISPGVFLPLLGDSEHDQVFRQGLDQTLAWLSRWDAAGLNLTVSINLPPSTLLDQECPRWVADSLTRHGIAPERLCLELLETGDFNADRKNITIEQLRQQGVKLAMDDLGSGYSSLKRLSKLTFDMIKVDQDLLKELYIHPLETLGLITTIINLGRYYRHEVTAEGLEDAGMLEVAAILGAQFGQGYAISRPMPAESVADWIHGTVITPYTGHIQTFIGALTYHHHILMNDRKDKMDINTCPVGRFLVEHGLRDADAYRWHAEFHAGHDEAGKLLLDWLVEQVKETGGS